MEVTIFVMAGISALAGLHSTVGSASDSRARDPGSILGPATYFLFSFHWFKKGSVVSYWQKYVHEVLVNHLGGLSLPRKHVVRVTDSPDMTSAAYHGIKQQQQTTIKLHLVKQLVKEGNSSLVYFEDWDTVGSYKNFWQSGTRSTILFHNWNFFFYAPVTIVRGH